MGAALWQVMLDWLHEPVLGLTRGDLLLMLVVVALAALMIGIKAVRK